MMISKGTLCSRLVPKNAHLASKKVPMVLTLRSTRTASRGSSGGSATKRTRSENPTRTSTSGVNAKNQPSSSEAAASNAAAAPPCATPNESVFIFASEELGRHDEGLGRYPHLRSPGGVLRGLDYLGTVTFALTGSVTAAQSGLDVFGCSMVGMVTAVGGGTIRDAVFLSRRPFWTLETEYIWMTIFTAFATFYVWPSVIEWQEERRKRKVDDEGHSSEDVQYDEVDAVLDTFDSIGLAAFAVIGAQNGVRAGVPIVVSAICGMATSTFGGLTRDVLCGRPVRIVHSNAEVYAQPALAGATVYLGAKRIGATPAVRIGAAMATCMGSRYWAIRNDVKLHTWDTKNDGLGVAVRK